MMQSIQVHIEPIEDPAPLRCAMCEQESPGDGMVRVNSAPVHPNCTGSYLNALAAAGVTPN